MAIALKLFSAFCLLTIFSCNNQPENKPLKDVQKEVQSICKPYFDYDKLDHYRINIGHDELWEMEKKKIKTTKGEKQLELLLQWTPDKLSDSMVVKNLEELDFLKREVSTDMFDEINKIFCERKHKDLFWNSCIAEYRDILVFKKKNKIIGIAKICFSCDQNVITGTALNTFEFGQSGDYKKLYNLLQSGL